MKSSEVHRLTRSLVEKYALTVLLYEGAGRKQTLGVQGHEGLALVWETLDNLWHSLDDKNRWGLIQDVLIKDDQGRQWLLHAVESEPRFLAAVGPLGRDGRPTYDSVVRLLNPPVTWSASRPVAPSLDLGALNRVDVPAMVDAIRQGDLEGFDQAGQRLIAWWRGRTATSPVERIFGLHVAFVAFCEMAAVKAGVAADVASAAAKVCVRTIELCTDPAEGIQNLVARLRRFAELVSQAHLQGKSAPVRTMLRFLSQNLQRAVTLQEAASVAGLSPNYAGTLFKLEAGEGFTDTLRRLRIERAQTLLRSTRTPIQEIASLVGFRQPDYFTKIFQTHLGCSPREYRRSAWETGDLSGIPSLTSVSQVDTWKG
jgi:AraC-like DNA-binding protein